MMDGCDDTEERSSSSKGANDDNGMKNVTIPYLRRLVFYAEALAYGAPKSTNQDEHQHQQQREEDGEALINHLAQTLLLAADPLNLISSKTVPAEFLEDGDDIGRVVNDDDIETMQDNDDEDIELLTDDCIPYKFIPLRVKGGRKRDPTRIDALRHLLRAMAPVAFDVATRACCHVLISNHANNNNDDNNGTPIDDNEEQIIEERRKRKNSITENILMGMTA